MKKIRKLQELCEKYRVGLCYLFGSQKDVGREFLEGRPIDPTDPESDIDFGVLFEDLPEDSLRLYASLSLDLQDLVAPFKADLLFLHEVDHLIQLEVIQGINIYARNEEMREAYEHKVMMFASDELEIFKRNEMDFLEAIENGYFPFEYEADRR